jgi:hypothetical protein
MAILRIPKVLILPPRFRPRKYRGCRKKAAQSSSLKRRSSLVSASSFRRGDSAAGKPKT